MHRIVCLLLLSLLLIGCGPNFVYEHDYEIGDAGWAHDQPLRFAFEVSDTQQLYNLHLLLGHTPDFGYQNMYVQIRTIFPDGQEQEEAVSLEIADKFGRWLGRCRSNSCDLPIIIQQKAYFNQIGEHRIEIGQWTRETSLKAIQSLGFKLEALAEKREYEKSE